MTPAVTGNILTKEDAGCQSVSVTKRTDLLPFWYLKDDSHAHDAMVTTGRLQCSKRCVNTYIMCKQFPCTRNVQNDVLLCNDTQPWDNLKAGWLMG